jgi:hypothetical protein
MIDKRYESGIGWDVVHRFRIEDKFADLMLISWGMVEMEVDLALRWIFGISHDDPKNDLVLHHPFRRKVEFLRKKEFFTKEEGQALLKFEEERNDMFHKLFRGLIFDIQKPETRSKIMDDAVIAVQVCMNAGSRLRFPGVTIDQQPNPFVVWKSSGSLDVTITETP